MSAIAGGLGWSFGASRAKLEATCLVKSPALPLAVHKISFLETSGGKDISLKF